MTSLQAPGQAAQAAPATVPATPLTSSAKEVHARAKLAMQLGLSSLFCAFIAPFALALGLIAKREMAARPNHYSNASHATVGIVMGGLLSAVLLVAVVLALATDPQENTAYVARAPRAVPAAGTSRAAPAPRPPSARAAVIAPKRPRGYVERSDLGDEWPLTVEAGELSCEAPGAVFFTVGGVRYSVNGLAEAKRFAAKDIRPIWAQDAKLMRQTIGEDMRKSIMPLIQRGRELCR